jgi:predicted nucleic acid-binding protein
LQIASIALRHAGVLVTHNRRHYERVQGLQITDWL